MSDRAHLKLVAFVWATVAVLGAAQADTGWSLLIFGMGGVAYIASFFAREDR
jgi:hypothetical protein